MSEKPSFLSSTFSLIALIASVGFVGLCCWMKNVDGLKEFVLLILGGYSMKKGIETQQHGHGQPPAPPAAS